MFTYSRVCLLIFFVFPGYGCRSVNDDKYADVPEVSNVMDSTIVVFDKDYIWLVGSDLILPRGGVRIRLKEISQKQIKLQGVPVDEFTTNEELTIPINFPTYFRWGNNVIMNIQKVDSENKWVRVRFVKGAVIM